MIFDLIENAEKYLGLHPNLDLALKNLNTPEALSGEKVKCNPAAYATIDPEKARFGICRAGGSGWLFLYRRGGCGNPFEAR